VYGLFYVLHGSLRVGCIACVMDTLGDNWKPHRYPMWPDVPLISMLIHFEYTGI
jgi:hypothetical protein